MMRGIDKIIACRKSGKKPVMVSLWIGYSRVLETGNTFDVIMPVPSASEDLRAFVGLNVSVFASEFSPAVLAVYERLKKVIAFGVLSVNGWSDPDSVFVFTPQRGELSLSDWIK